MSLLKKIKSLPVSKMGVGDMVKEMQMIVTRDPIVLYSLKSIRNLPSFSMKDYIRYHELVKELNIRGYRKR